jgi:hypothetical protein
MTSERPERRSEARIATSIAAKLDLQNGTMWECFIWDISNNGAHVLIDGDERCLPDTVVLWLCEDGKVKRRGSVAWRLPGRLGVLFQEAPLMFAR